MHKFFMRAWAALLLAFMAAQPAVAQDVVARGLAVQAKASTAKVALTDKLRRAARIAQAGNPLTALPWTVATPWAASTTYPLQSIVSAVQGGVTRYYVQLNTSGVSAASAPIWRGDGVPTTDGTCAWVYVGDQPMTANDPAAPSVTTASGFTPLGSGNSVLWYPVVYPSLYTIQGAEATVYATNSWQLSGFNASASTTGGGGFVITTVVDDAKFAVGFTSGSPPAGIIIDGRFYSPQVSFLAAGNPNWIVFDFGSRKPRTVQIVAGKGAYSFAGIATQANGTLQAAPAPEVNAVFIADSYGEGSSYGPFRAESLLGTQVGLRLGWSVRNMVKGATGVLNPNVSFYTYPQRVLDSRNAANIAAADVVFLYGSTNDNSYAAAAISAAVAQTIANIRTLNKAAPIIWFGPASIDKAGSAPIASNKATDTAVAAGVAAANDALTFYVPFANATVPPIVGSYLTGMPSGANSYQTLINTGDGVHPTDLGTFVIAKWMADTIRAKLALL